MDQIGYSYSDSIAGYVTDFNRSEQSFGLKTSDGRAFRAYLTPTVYARIAQNLEDPYADCTGRLAELWRGIEFLFFVLERARRLPLRAGFAAFLVKNSVPIGYVEALALFERVEIGFNIYYTFREGESPWIFARVLKLLNQVLGARSFSIDPYQIGHENREAIDSGAFWFYRKLGFRSTSRDVQRLIAREEERIARDPAHRSSRRTLERIATANLLYDFDGERAGSVERSRVASGSAWDRFHVRNLGLAVNRRMARESGGDSGAARGKALSRVGRALGLRLESWPLERRQSLEHVGGVKQQIEGPGQPRGGGLMTRHEQGEQLVFSELRRPRWVHQLEAGFS